MRQALNASSHPTGGSSPMRWVSLLLAIAVSGVILTYPKAYGNLSHGLLSLIMLGTCAGFVHGVGFVPIHPVWRALFSPWLAWPLMGLGLWQLFAN